MTRAADLTYMQRKTLRRIARGQIIRWDMRQDAVIAQCATWPLLEPPSADMNVVEYCDWESEWRSARPVLTEFGKKLLAELGDPLDT